MKRYLTLAAITVICIGLFCSFPALNQVQAQGKKAVSTAEKLTVLNPMGTPPAIQRKAQAPRLDTLDGKTIYFVNTGYIGTDRLMVVMTDWFKANYPKTNVVIKAGGGGMTAISEAVRTELREKADAAIVGLGH